MLFATCRTEGFEWSLVGHPYERPLPILYQEYCDTLMPELTLPMIVANMVSRKPSSVVKSPVVQVSSGAPLVMLRKSKWMSAGSAPAMIAVRSRVTMQRRAPMPVLASSPRFAVCVVPYGLFDPAWKSTAPQRNLKRVYAVTATRRRSLAYPPLRRLCSSRTGGCVPPGPGALRRSCAEDRQPRALVARGGCAPVRSTMQGDRCLSRARSHRKDRRRSRSFYRSSPADRSSPGSILVGASDDVPLRRHTTAAKATRSTGPTEMLTTSAGYVRDARAEASCTSTSATGAIG